MLWLWLWKLMMNILLSAINCKLLIEVAFESQDYLNCVFVSGGPGGTEPQPHRGTLVQKVFWTPFLEKRWRRWGQRLWRGAARPLPKGLILWYLSFLLKKKRKEKERKIEIARTTVFYCICYQSGERLAGAPGVLCLPSATAQPCAGGLQWSRHLCAQSEPAHVWVWIHPEALQIPAHAHRKRSGCLW